MASRTPSHTAGAALVNWISPPDYVAAARKVLGSIDLDPCASRATTIAETNWRLEDGQDGLVLPWEMHGVGSFFINPPFGTSYVRGPECLSAQQMKALREAVEQNKADALGAVGWRQQVVADWAARAVQAHRAGMEGVWLSKMIGNSVAAQTVLGAASAVCYPDQRIAYINAATGKAKAGADFDSFVVYMGEDPRRFAAIFAQFGVVHVLATPCIDVDAAAG